MNYHCSKDYRLTNVNKKIFSAVLTGDKDAVRNRGSGRVLEATEDDNVFIYFSGLSSYKFIQLPSFDNIYADELESLFRQMTYKNLVFYLEGTNGASLFNTLPSDLRVFAVTASGPTEQSYATHCRPYDKARGKHIGSCMSNEFSASWMNIWESLGEATCYVRFNWEANANASTVPRSHPQGLGNEDVGKLWIGEFLGRECPNRPWLEKLIILLKKIWDWIFGESKVVMSEVSRLQDVLIHISYEADSLKDFN